MKSTFKFFAIVPIFAFLLHSCSSDDDSSGAAAPLISNFEYGEGSAHSTDRVAYKGSDIHLEAEIDAQGSVGDITLSIHAHGLTPGDGEVDWDYEQKFNKSDYMVINPSFHEHVDIPTDIPAGEYHIELTVTDLLGNSTTVEGHLQILDPITLGDISLDTTVVRGNDFHAEFLVGAVHGIHSITLDIHAHGIEPGAGEVEWHLEQVFEEGYHGLTEVEFHEHIDVPATAPAGEYHMVFTIEDEQGNTRSLDAHLVVSIP